MSPGGGWTVTPCGFRAGDAALVVPPRSRGGRWFFRPRHLPSLMR